MESESAFSRFKGVSDKLKNAIKPSAMAVAEKLLAKGLLAQATYDEMIDGRDNAIKAAKIVNELQAALKIRDNPDKYLNEICDALREVEEPLITDMANKLSTGTSTPASTVSTSQATPHTVPSGIDAKIAKEVLNASGDDLKKIDLKYLAGKMLVQKIITDDQKRTIVDDRMAGLGGDERMDKLLNILKDTVAVNDSIFTWFIEILEGHNVASQGIAQGLQKKYEELLMESTKKKPCTGTLATVPTVLPQATPAHTAPSGIDTKIPVTQKDTSKAAGVEDSGPSKEANFEDNDSPDGPTKTVEPPEWTDNPKKYKKEDRPFTDDLTKDIKFLLMPATPAEEEQFLLYLEPKDESSDKYIKTSIDNIPLYIGKYGKNPVIIAKTAPDKDKQGPINATFVATILLNKIKSIEYVVAVGVCFGIHQDKQRLGDVVISSIICDFVNKREGTTVHPRGAQYGVEDEILNIFRPPYDFEMPHNNNKPLTGPIISQSDLIDNPTVKASLVNSRPDAIGGEMEGAAIMTVTKKIKPPATCIIIKGIGDWADGKKEGSKEWKKYAARAAAYYVKAALNEFPSD